MKSVSLAQVSRHFCTLLLISMTAACASQQAAIPPSPLPDSSVADAPASADAPTSDPPIDHVEAVEVQSHPVEMAPMPEPVLVLPEESVSASSGEHDSTGIETIEAMPIASVKSHFWSRLDEFESEPPGYAAYTYVLTGRTGPASEHVRRYQQLVDAITASTAAGPSSNSSFSLRKKAESNVFVIPSTPTLAQQYVTTLQATVDKENERFFDPGPFLVVLAKPLDSNQRGIENMLLADLSSIHEGAFKEIVKTLKRRLTSDDVTDIEILRSIKSLLLSSLFIAEDSLVFASVAHAEFRELFKSE